MILQIIQVNCEPGEAAELIRLALLVDVVPELPAVPAIPRAATGLPLVAASVPSAAVPPAAAEIKKRRGRPAKLVEAAPAAAPVAAPDPEKSLRGQILGILIKQAMSSAELAEKLKVPAQKVYTATSSLKEAGSIETFQDDDSDGGRRWRIKRVPFVPKPLD